MFLKEFFMERFVFGKNLIVIESLDQTEQVIINFVLNINEFRFYDCDIAIAIIRISRS